MQVSFSMIVVTNLPTELTYINALTSLDGKGVYVYGEGHFFELVCDLNMCTWTTMSNQLPINVTSTIMMHLPSKLSCINSNTGIGNAV